MSSEGISPKSAESKDSFEMIKNTEYEYSQTSYRRYRGNKTKSSVERLQRSTKTP